MLAANCKSFDFSVAGSDGGPQYYVDGAMVQEDRPPEMHPPKGKDFQRRRAGGGGGAGGGRGGLGGRHATKAAADVLPSRAASLSLHAARYVANKPPQVAVPKADAFKEQKSKPTTFRHLYERGDLPLRVNGGVHKYVAWHLGDDYRPAGKQAPSQTAAGGADYEEAKGRFLAALDYDVYLPLFFDGLREKGEPCRFLAVRGLYELLEAADASKVNPTVSRLVLPIRQALNTKEPAIVRRTIVALRQLVSVTPDPVSGARVGEALLPYLRHFLPIFNLFKSNAKFARNADDYSISLGELMDETLHLFAAEGGHGAAREINRLVPLWEPPPGST